MCGIVGHIGAVNSLKRVLDGLSRLEYRGYDSAGVCFKNKSGELTLFKKAGKLENLSSLFKGKNFVTHNCIGHTRWATHGVVNDENSHPHSNIDVATVHNGIIENSLALKKELLAEGYKFSSQTDSEVFLVLVTKYLKETKSLMQAAANAFARIKGNSAFVIQAKDSKEIIGLRKGAPLVCGINNKTNELMISSDPYALVGVVEVIFFPEDEVLCKLSCNKKVKIEFFELDLMTKSERYTTKIQNAEVSREEKGLYEHYMLKEIFEQPILVRNLIKIYSEKEYLNNTIALDVNAINRIYIVGCGTAYYAGLLIKLFIERILRIPVFCEYASEFRYSGPLLTRESVAIFISQSGETADTLAAQKLCKMAGVRTVSIVNVENSSLYRACDQNILIHAGIEIGVASTKAFTQQVLAGRFLVNQLSKDDSKEALEKKVAILGQRMEGVLSEIELIKKIASNIHCFKGFIFTGRGRYFPIALEGALKLKEIGYVHAEGYASGELKHGPIALIDEEMVNVAIVGPELYEKTVSNIQEVKARKSKIVIFGPEGDDDLISLADYYFPLNFTGLGELSPLYVNICNQLLAYYIAKNKGTDIDMPRNLAKSVTVE